MAAKQHCRHYCVLYGACSKDILLQRSPGQAVAYCDRIVQRALLNTVRSNVPSKGMISYFILINHTTQAS